MKPCPNCSRSNPDDLVLCDCGYDYGGGSSAQSTDVGHEDRAAPGRSHTLWKQVLGVVIVTLVVLLLFWPASVLVVVVGLLVFADAWVAGVRKDPAKSSFLNLSPMAWTVAIDGLFILAFPLYVANREKLKTREGNRSLWFSTVAVGGVVFLLSALWIVAAMSRHL